MRNASYSFYLSTEKPFQDIWIRFLKEANSATDKVKFSLERAMKVQRGSRDIALLFL
jgi:hypothetical protein